MADHPDNPQMSMFGLAPTWMARFSGHDWEERSAFNVPTISALVNKEQRSLFTSEEIRYHYTQWK